jgi:nicotinamidase-related amidase
MTTALLVMDLQAGIVARYGERGTALVATLSRAVTYAHARGDLVVFVRVAVRSGGHVSGRNVMFSALADAEGFGDDAAGTQIVDGLGRNANDVVVTKRRVSAFSGSDLEVTLRAHDVDHLVLAGIATGGVVLSTLRQAADLDYGLTVLSDGCLDADDEVHRVLTEKVFVRQARVLRADEWIAQA